MNAPTIISRPTQPRYGIGSRLRSTLDPDNLTNQHKKTDVVKSSTFNLAGQVSRLVEIETRKRRRILTPPIQSKDTILSHPFKIYQPSNTSSLTQGVTFLGEDGTPTVCMITSAPTDFTATPPHVNSGETWRFWTVRSGMIDYRPIYNFEGSFPPTNSQVTWVYGYDAQNWVWKWHMTGRDANNQFDYTDGVVPFDDPSLKMNETQSVLIVPDGDSGDTFQFSIWINFIQETTTDFWSFTIRATRHDDSIDNSSGYPDSTFGIIPVGVIQFLGGSTSNTQIYQYLFDHVNNRYPAQSQGNFSGQISKPSGSVMNYRGKWDKSNNRFEPLDLTSQVFYSGDCVKIYNSDPEANVDGLYQFTGRVPHLTPNVWEDPSSSSSWQLIV